MTAGEKQRFILSHFGDQVRKSDFELFSPTTIETLTKSGGFIVGVCPSFISEDLRFLDSLGFVYRKAINKPNIYLLDMTSLESPEQVQEVFQGFELWNQSPVVAFWSAGKQAWIYAGDIAKSKIVSHLRDST
jgi:hypothetical protein